MCVCVCVCVCVCIHLTLHICREIMTSYDEQGEIHTYCY